MRRVLISIGIVVALLLLWGPIPIGGGGTLGGIGHSITRWGIPGAATVTTELASYHAGDRPTSRSVEFSWPGFAVSAVLTAGVCWLGSRLWRRKQAHPGASPNADSVR